MRLYDIILIAISLAMDASAVTISNCTAYKHTLTTKRTWAMPITFAIFQGIMPLIGFFVGSIFSSFICKIAGFLSSAIFFILSGKIFIDIIKDKRECVCTLSEQRAQYEKEKTAILTIPMLFLQGVATSIDALVVGITFINLTFSIFLAVLVIAVLTFIVVGIALLLGQKLGCAFGKYADYVGAFILLALAIKSLVQALI